MDKLKLGEWGERLKTSGSQMGKTISEKMKDLLQTPTPESRIVDDATSETLDEPNWGLNMRICKMINAEELNGTEVVKAIKKKINKSVGVGVVSQQQRLSLELLEACTTNCDKVCSEVSSEKLLDDLVRLVDNANADPENRRRAWELIRAWGESDELVYLPVFRQTYLNLKNRGASQSIDDGTLPPMQQSIESYIHQEPLPPPESYPIPDSGMHNDDNAFSIAYQTMSADEKKEFLVVTRNTLELLSSILNSDTEPKLIKDDLTVSMLDKCRRAQPVLQRIIESTVDDDGLLFEALSLHDGLQEAITKYDELEAAESSGEQLPEGTDPAEVNPLGISEERKEADLSEEKYIRDLSKGVSGMDVSKGESDIDPWKGEKTTDILKGEGSMYQSKGENDIDILKGEGTKNINQRETVRACDLEGTQCSSNKTSAE